MNIMTERRLEMRQRNSLEINIFYKKKLKVKEIK